MRRAQVQSNTFVIGGRYEIKDPPIGQGGMGVVYKAHDRITRRFVALKTIWGVANPPALVLFEREWSVLARLSHPNIVDIIETGQFEDEGQSKPYFVMPLLPGVTLDQLIKDASPRLTVETTVEIMAQTCRGLQAAHDLGLIHRDLKPSNIFVLDDNSVKIIDFGVVHLTDSRTLTEMKGTLNYLAPELLDRKAPSVLSDVFALGVVCYEALTGRKPFGRPTENETVEAIRKHIPPPVSDMNAAANQRMSRTVHKAIAKQPWHRFVSARDFSDTLQKALRNEPIEYFDPVKIQPRIERVRKAQAEGDHQFAKEILSELEAEGHIDLQISMLRIQLDQAIQQQTVRHLMESARTRMEEEEYPLALQKVQEVLEIVPHHVDALRLKSEIERHRNEKQVDSWYRIAHQHLDNQLFAQARQAMGEILRIQPSDAKAQSLLARIDREEKESVRLREEKEQLYQVALRCYRDGEVSTALNKLERLLSLSRGVPGADNQEREAQYQNLYNQIRSEREVFRNAYAEARRHLENRNFEGVLGLCAEFLRKSPLDPMFQALKLEAEENERQERSAAVAAVRVRVEAEADLDRQINILKEAAERYPGEPYFRESLKLVRERRDLVNSILNRARQYEQKSQFNEALGQWDILKNIYPKYPGLEVEAERLARKRDEQAKEETKSRWVRQIDQHLESGEYERAQSVLRDALAEFPGDRELSSMEKLVTQGAERQAEAQKYFDEGAALCTRRQFDEALPKLRKAVELNDRSRTMRIALVNALLDKGRIVIQDDWRAAQAMVSEALHLEPNDPVACSLLAQIQDQVRQAFVEGCIFETRELQSAGNLQDALATARSGLAKYPTESRLSQLENTLLNSLNRSAEPKEVLLLQPPAPRNRRLTPVASDRPKSAKREPAVSQSAEPPPQAAPSAVASNVPVESQASPAAAAAPPQTQSGKRKTSALSQWQWVGIIAVPLLVVAVLVILKLKPAVTRIHLHANVDGVRFTVDGQQVSSDTVSLSLRRAHRLEAARDGYETAVRQVTPAGSEQGVEFILNPVAPQLRFSSNLLVGTASLGDQPAMALQSGGFTAQSLPPGNPVLKVSDGAQKSLEIPLRIEAGKPIVLAGPIAAQNCTAILVSVAGARATVYATPDVKGSAGNLPPQPVPPDGLLLDTGTVGQDFVLSSGQKFNIQPATRPSVEISMLEAESSEAGHDVPEKGKAFLRFRSVEPGADVYIDGEHWGKVTGTGFLEIAVRAGTHQVVLTKFQYENSRTLVAHLKPGGTQVITGKDLPLVQQGALTFSLEPSTATARYEMKSAHTHHQSGMSRANETAFLKPGVYVLHVEAPGHAAVTQTITVKPGQRTEVKLVLAASSSPGPSPVAGGTNPLFDDPSSWVRDNDWWTFKVQQYGWLRPNRGAFDVSIKRQSKGILGKSAKRVEWTLDFRAEGDKVVYWIDANILHRMVFQGGKVVLDDPRAALKAKASDVYHFTFDISPFRISVRDSIGNKLDEFDRPNSKVALGKFGFLGPVSLSVQQTR